MMEKMVEYGLIVTEKVQMIRKSHRDSFLSKPSVA